MSAEALFQIAAGPPRHLKYNVFPFVPFSVLKVSIVPILGFGIAVDSGIQDADASDSSSNIHTLHS